MDNDDTHHALYETPVDFIRVVRSGSDEQFAALAARLDEIGRDTVPDDVVMNCFTFARCAYFLKRFNIPVDAIIHQITIAYCPILRANPFSSTLLNFNCVVYKFTERAADYIRGLLDAGARVDLVSDLGETPLEVFYRSASGREGAPDVEGIVHTMLCAEGHSTRAFHDGVQRILANDIMHPGFETLRNYEVVEAFAAHSHTKTLPMELCRMVACAMGVPP